MTAELFDDVDAYETANPSTTLAGRPAVKASIVVEYLADMDDTVERLVGLGSLSLTECRRAAFSIVGEDIADASVRELIRGLYAPTLENDKLTKRNNTLDGGIGR